MSLAPGRLDFIRIRTFIAEGENEGRRLARERLIEKLADFGRAPGDVADADPRIAGGAELLFHPGFAARADARIAIAAADEAEVRPPG